MNKFKKSVLTLFLICVSYIIIHAQYQDIGKSEEPYFYEIVEHHEKEIQKKIDANKGETKGTGKTPFNRWKAFWEQRIGNYGKMSDSYSAIQMARSQTSDCASESDWTEIGPFNFPDPGNSQRGIGRANFVKLHPDYNNSTNKTLYSGGFGGLWRTADNGDHWTNMNSDDFEVTACSDLAVLKTTLDGSDSSNDEILLVSTGNKKTGSSPYLTSLGLKRSTDDGANWTSIHLDGTPWEAVNYRSITEIAVDPNNNQRVYACTSQFVWTPGISFFPEDSLETDRYLGQLYVSENYGLTWTIIYEGFYIEDFEFKPNDSNTFYFSGHRLVKGNRASNGQYTFENLSSNLGERFNFDLTDGAHAKKMHVEVSPINPNNLWVLAANLTDASGPNPYSPHVLWKSNDAGDNFEVVSYYEPGNVGLPLANWIHMAFEVSHVDDNLMYFGAVKSSRSIDGGENWIKIPTNMVHDDTNDAEVSDGQQVFLANDAGVYRSFDHGVTWEPASDGLAVGQVYDIGMSSRFKNSVPDIIEAGFQDVTCMTKSPNTDFFQPNGVYGDGIVCIVDPVNPEIIYNESQGGGTRRSTDGGLSFSQYNVGGQGLFRTPMMLDPNDHNRFFVGKDQLRMRTPNTNIPTVFTNPFSVASVDNKKITAFNIAKSNSDIIYTAYEQGVPIYDAAQYDFWWQDPNVEIIEQLFKSIDGGQNWTDISPTNLIGNQYANITSVEIHPTNPNRIWVTYTRYSWQFKVIKSDDGGLTWQNFSDGLPPIPINKIIITPTARDIPACEFLYLATDFGVYYRNGTMSQWECFSDNIPNVPVNDIEIDPYQKIIRSTTLGRGIWESSLHPEDRLHGTSDFTIDMTCPKAGQIRVEVTAFENWPNSHWELYEMGEPDDNNPLCENPSDFTCDANTLTGSISVQQGNTAVFNISDLSKFYYIKHTNWDNCHVQQEVRTHIPIQSLAVEASFHFENYLGESTNMFCNGEDVFLNGSASQSETQYLIRVNRRIINSNAVYSPVSLLNWTLGELGLINLSNIIENFGSPQHTFESGYEYEITLEVEGGTCSLSDAVSHSFIISDDVTLDPKFKLLTTNPGPPAGVSTHFTEPYTDLGAIHEWHIFHSPNNVAGPYKNLEMQDGPQAFFYAHLPGYWIIVHKVYTGCSEACYLVVFQSPESTPFDCTNIGGCGLVDCSVLEDLYNEVDPCPPGQTCFRMANIDSDGIQIYPNPSTGLLNIKVEQKGNHTIKVINMLGEIMYDNDHLMSHAMQINLDHLASGLYLVQIENPHSQISTFMWTIK